MTHALFTWTVILTVIFLCAAVLCACLLHLTPRQFKGESRWNRLRRSLWERAEKRRPWLDE